MGALVWRRLRPKDGVSFLTHFVSLLVAIPAGLFLIEIAHDWYGDVGAKVYGIGLVSVFFGSSICHHGGGCDDAWQTALDRLDRVGIFLMIAGTATPICLVLRNGVALATLGSVWIIAIVGIFLTIQRPLLPPFWTAILYV